MLAYLRRQAYHFITPTPATHERVLRHKLPGPSRDLRDAFGWSLPFDPTILAGGLLQALLSAGHLAAEGDAIRSNVRVSSLGPNLFVHSAFPTEAEDSVFFGPDSYRFADLIARELSRCPERDGARLVDIGTGAGVGGIAAAMLCPNVEIALTDVNPKALAFARVNAAAAGVRSDFHLTSDLSPIEGDLDLIFANPPYIINAAARTYRDGGGMHGAEVSLDMAKEAVPRLAPAGRFVLYTGSAIIDGQDALQAALSSLADDQHCALDYREIDPDVFGEELDEPAYHGVERIALVSAVIERGR
ncbi:methyltransferase [Sphingomonas sp. ID0503]|uniref:methyltransferase n=1 Tax=Sphingomonas sp. ID0503 TaxID=3399691 RepID=UPI003AFAB5F1